MDLPKYEDVSREIRHYLSQGFKRRNEDEMFATRILAQTVLSDQQLRRVHKSLKELHSRPSTSANASKEDLFIQNIKDKSLYDFLAVLLYAYCSKSAAQSFEAKLVFGDGLKINLPVSKEDLIRLFGEGSRDIDEVLRCQKYFRTIVIGFPEDNVLQASDSWRKPWLSETPLGSGSYGSVFEVHIAEHHFTENRKLERTYTTAQVIARKDFTVDKQGSFKKEVQVMKEIRESAEGHDNILKSFGTLIIEGEKPEFSLFMPKAETDLAKYLSEIKNDGKPLVVDERCGLISSAMGLANGLHFLHTEINAKGMRQRVCYHMDLKPANVLIFPGENHQIWKISDFGMSKVKDKPVGSTQKDDVLTDFAMLFKRRSGVDTGAASKTVIGRDRSTFLPSEALGRGKAMNEKSDVWALGCIISLLFTYMESQAEGLERYVDLRVEHSNLRSDTFYGKDTMTRSYPVNKGVVKQHKALVKAAAGRESTEEKAIKSMLRFLEDKVFLERQDKRCAASEVREKLRETRKKYQAVAKSSTQGTKERPGILDSILGRKKHEDAMPASGPAVSVDFVSWRLNEYKNTKAKGCDCSPNGNFIAYWDEAKIMIFTKSHGVNAELPPVDKEGRKPDDSDRSWKAIKLTNRYLIAITTGSEENCYIFDMKRAQDLTVYTIFSLPDSETSLLDISPDLRSFMCIRKSSDGRGLFCSSTIKPSTELPVSEIQKTPAHGQKKIEARISLINDKRAKLKWRAADMLQIISQSKNRGYLAFRNQDSPLLLSIAFFCVDEFSHVEAELDETNFTGETASLFTHMACISNGGTGNEVLAVLQTRRMSQVSFKDPKTTPVISTKLPVEDYRILKIAIDKSSGKIIALGVRSLIDSVCLLEIKWRTDSNLLQVKNCLAVLDRLLEADEPKFRICEDHGQKIALITSLTLNGRHAVYQVSLNGLSRA